MLNRTKSAYTRYELKRELSDVFKSVYFIDLKQKIKIEESYFLNFDALIDYARAKSIDEKEYVRDIRNQLLKCQQVYDAR